MPGGVGGKAREGLPIPIALALSFPQERLISIPIHDKIITSRGTLGFEHSEPGQDRNVAALRTLFDARSTLRLFFGVGFQK